MSIKTGVAYQRSICSIRVATIHMLVAGTLILMASACERNTPQDLVHDAPRTRTIPTFAPLEPTIPTFERHSPFPGVSLLKPIDWQAAALLNGSTIYAEREISLTGGDGARFLVAGLEPDPDSSLALHDRLVAEASSDPALQALVAALSDSRAFDLLGPLDELLQSNMMGLGFVRREPYVAISLDGRDIIAAQLDDEDPGTNSSRVSPVMTARVVAIRSPHETEVRDNAASVVGIAIVAIAPSAAWENYEESFDSMIKGLIWDDPS